MKINRNNYEAFFVDYLEGKLDEKLVNDFIEFLGQNPDLKQELSLFETLPIEHEVITFNKKELLLKEKYDVENVFIETAIASVEGDISLSEKTEFEDYLSRHPEKQKEADFFKLTKLQPDESVVFSKKGKLYRRTTGKTVLLWSARVAALLVFALAIYLFTDSSRQKINPENQLATIQKETDTTVKSVETTRSNEELQNNSVELVQSPVKKQKLKSIQTISFQKKNEEIGESNSLASTKVSVEAPPKMQSLTPSFNQVSPGVYLAEVPLSAGENNEITYDEKFLVDLVKNKTGIENLSINKIAKAGLSVVSTLSKEKFSFDTNSEGKITELNYDSRILAFSIPTNHDKPEK